MIPVSQYYLYGCSFSNAKNATYFRKVLDVFHGKWFSQLPSVFLLHFFYKGNLWKCGTGYYGLQILFLLPNWRCKSIEGNSILQYCILTKIHSSILTENLVLHWFQIELGTTTAVLWPLYMSTWVSRYLPLKLEDVVGAKFYCLHALNNNNNNTNICNARSVSKHTESEAQKINDGT